VPLVLTDQHGTEEPPPCSTNLISLSEGLFPNAPGFLVSHQTFTVAQSEVKLEISPMMEETCLGKMLCSRHSAP